MKFNEDSRVKIPSILHLVRLGYEYLSLKNQKWDKETNIFTNIFLESVQRINHDIEKDEAQRLLSDISLMLDNEDLGRQFYERLIQQEGHKIIDFENFGNNTFNVVTELTYKNGEDEFRPDIILLINGLPLVFIEVKKPNNKEGILAERKRINQRFQNKKFRRFINITQLMVFSNNMEYDPNDLDQIQGAFYASASYHKPIFNFFREEENFDLSKLLKPEDEAIEDEILKDNNLVIIKRSPEFLTNKSPKTPTNRISTSLFSRDRLKFTLQYAIAYVNEVKGLEKHIMRYPQIFATKAIAKSLDKDIRKGIIWHTQGSGKTALAYYNVKHLTDYYQEKNIIPKFYFIVDRLDLLLQAKREFSARGLTVNIVNSRSEFAKDIKVKSAIKNDRGNPEITVVNIQKFSDDAQIIKEQDYDINVQRIYFLDEVHRSYNPEGSFLANLEQSDKQAVKIGLTGTPLLGDDYNSRSLFGDYIHKYYYNASIADGYTLRLIREEIETNYKMVLEEALKAIEIQQGNISKKEIYAHHKFVEPMLDYIVNDFEAFRLTYADNSIGGMVVCDSSDQAKMMFEIFNKKYRQQPELVTQAAEEPESYGDNKRKRYKVKTAALILHDIGTKEERKDQVEDFKAGKIDILFVYNMLLTGFDAKRLKKLYIGRIIKKHNLLQTLTRVNRTYKNYRYGYVVDFADIREEFNKTNRDYFNELQEVLGNEIEHYSNIFKSKEEIQEEIADIKEVLFHFDTQNAEIFSQQVSEISDPKKMTEIVKALGNAKSLYNLIRLFGHYELLEKIDFKKLSILYREASNHLQLINQKDAVENSTDTTNLLNVALEDIIFKFNKIGEEELILADQLKDTLRKTREELANNFDKKDPEFVSLYEELERLFKKKKLEEVSQEEMKANIGALKDIHAKILELNRQNRLLQAKYNNDPKYCRIHKRLREKGGLTKRETQLFEALQSVKSEADLQVLQNSKLLENEGYLDKMMIRLVINQFVKQNNIPLNPETSKFINNLVVQEYTNEFHNRIA
ncbi:type I restriction endonuclease subunit R [Mesonia aestuariivivens]|uniref:type I site-specific deoxyribonuclease n=1 Tax=Mesonia aestuariivivens TaxID=2796128 RepID=A0ABS6VXW7_9FLAO|nr:type I restriction endonuclease [Mesonia aestuariivivens]MBW2960420.1 DEAD/DEAH box helicase family protein [Mesonia aestuariivivens]